VNASAKTEGNKPDSSGKKSHKEKFENWHEAEKKSVFAPGTQ
jgi:hypothetical protein